MSALRPILTALAGLAYAAAEQEESVLPQPPVRIDACKMLYDEPCRVQSVTFADGSRWTAPSDARRHGQP